ncbi:MAG: S8 family serine peptidase [Solirubrobacteraceae bacterium]
MSWAIRWDRGTHAALVAIVACVVAAFTLHRGAAPGGATANRPVIVRGGAAAERAITRAGGTVDRNLKTLGLIIARVPRDSIASLRRAPGVGGVAPDAAVKLLGRSPKAGSASDPVAAAAPETTQLSDIRAAIDDTSPDAGHGVGVALIDSGAVPSPAFGDRLIIGPDFSTDSSDPDLAGLDAYGHGTHIAGIIAGNDPSTGFVGIAPGAHIVSVKVASADGSTTLADMLDAIAWVIEHRRDPGLNIRVLNLSFGATPEDSYEHDALAYAVEQAWRRGIAVVVSAGNSGEERNGLDSPAYDPTVIAVGADDLNGTPDVDDDTVPDWSSGDDLRHPDVVAPGTAVVSLRVPNSFLDVNHPGAAISDTTFRGSGTSQAAGVVSGAAAALIAGNPSLKPDQVKTLLTSTADDLRYTPASKQGAGRIDLAAAAEARPPRATGPKPRPADPRASRDDRAAHSDKPATPVVVGADGSLWTGAKWNGAKWNGSLWSGAKWNGSLWSMFEDGEAGS